MVERLILGGALLSSTEEPLEEDWGVVIDGAVIAAVGPNSDLYAARPNAEVIDATDLLLMPGFVNAHMHSYGLLAHGIPVDAPPRDFYELLADFWWPCVENRLDAPMIEAAIGLACYRMIRSGITSFCDVLEAPNASADILEVEADVVRKAGLRAILMTEASERINTACGERLTDENARFINSHEKDDLIHGMFCIHTSFSCSERFVTQAKRISNDLGCDIHLHLSESPYEPTACLKRYRLRPVEWYDQLGFWDSSVLASQVVAVDAAEIRLLAERGVRVAHMPLSNCDVGGGIAAVPAMLKEGIRPGLGSDGYINNMFEVMRGAFLIHKGVLQNRQVMPARTVLSMATSWGAEAIGVPETGEIAPGKLADLIGIELNFDTPLTAHNVLDQILLYRNPENVVMTIVNGEILMKNREVLTLDEEKVRHEVASQVKRLWGMK